MKRSTLLAAMIGVVLAGGGVYAVTQGTSSSSSPTGSPSATSSSQTTPGGVVAPERGAANAGVGSTSTSSTSTSPSSTAVDRNKGGATVNQPISPEAAARAAERGVDPAAMAAAPKHTGERQIRMPRPESVASLPAEDQAIARKKQFTKTITKAACTAPDIGERLAQMPAADGQQLIERCAAVGVTITPAKK